MQGNAEDRSIHADQWKVLALCNGSKRVSEIADTLRWDIFKTSKIIFQMVQDGLLERTGELLEEQKPLQKKNVNGSFFPHIENELKRLMGPIAPIIIDDIVTDIGESKESFPQELVDKLLEAIVAEIPDIAKRAEFHKVINNVLANETKAKL
jgi:DNA-binding MarR family transcriptional regulator